MQWAFIEKPIKLNRNCLWNVNFLLSKTDFNYNFHSHHPSINHSYVQFFFHLIFFCFVFNWLVSQENDRVKNYRWQVTRILLMEQNHNFFLYKKCFLCQQKKRKKNCIKCQNVKDWLTLKRNQFLNIFAASLSGILIFPSKIVVRLFYCCILTPCSI